MEYRKIQITGESTYIISLPKKWVKKSNLNKGDTIIIEEKGEGLWLKTREGGSRFSEIDVKDKTKEFLARLLITRYIKGYDMITFKSDKFIEPDKRKHLKKMSQYLIGMEPFGETSKEIMFKMLMYEGVDLTSTVSRMHEMSFSSLKDIINAIKNQENINENFLKSIIDGDNEIDKFYFLILRQLSNTHCSDVTAWFQIVKSIERLSDHIENIANLLLEGQGFDEIESYEPLVELYGEVMLSLRSGHPDMAEEVLVEIEKLRVKERKLLDNLQKKRDKSLLVYESFRRIGEYVSDIAEGVINLH
ncbi:MAG: hypothetical protein B6U72_04735 [Candidatus Altiarchaeales archaeon ex4484_2]|nr:MAG: hypothetical protein B6U72_04735 [Candidatus Altiarchaeales archaeon ex4484_2]